jgi:cell division protein FtsL
MSVVADLRQALQDVVTPDLKTVVAGLTGVRDELTQLRTKTASAEKRSTERLDKTELRLLERVERVYDAVKIADLTRRNAELEAAMEQLRKAQQPGEQQQH